MATPQPRPAAGTPQIDLFDTSLPLPDGLVYVLDFITSAEEQALLATFASLPFEEARYKEWTARRRVVSYGSRYDFGDNRLDDAPPVPAFLEPLRARAAAWVGNAPEEFTDALIAEYRPGTPLGWHRDVPQFERVVGISLAGRCRMRFRPYPLRDGRRPPRSLRSLPPEGAYQSLGAARRDWRESVFDLTLEPRSAYVLQREARWRWQHMIPPTPELRYSITFRTRATRRRA